LFIELHPMPPVGDGLFPAMVRRSVRLRQKAAVEETDFIQYIQPLFALNKPKVV
jgi:hypothetical protein